MTGYVFWNGRMHNSRRGFRHCIDGNLGRIRRKTRRRAERKSRVPHRPGEGKKKKRGAPVGHPGWVRPKPDRIDRTVHVPAPTICPHCQSDDLTPMEESTEHVQEDIVIRPRTLVTRYLHGQALCVRCNRPVVQAGEGELLNAPIGPVAKSVALYLRYRIGIPYRKTAELFRELFGLKFVPASALGFDRKAAARGRPIYEDLRDKIRASDVVHADETSWRSDGVGHFVWFAGNENLAFFHIDRHRSAEVAKTIFGEDFDGTLVRDRYAAYNGIGVDWQVCIAHIITKAKEISGEHALLPQTEKDTATGPFCDRLMDLCSRLCDAGQKLKSGDIPWKAAAKIEKRFVTELNNICKQTLRFKPAETLRTYLCRTRAEISLYLPPAPRRTAHQQSRGTVSQASGDLPQDMLRNQIGKRTENPQHPSQSGANRQKTRRPSKGVSANPPHCRYGNGSSCAV